MPSRFWGQEGGFPLQVFSACGAKVLTRTVSDRQNVAEERRGFFKRGCPRTSLAPLRGEAREGKGNLLSKDTNRFNKVVCWLEATHCNSSLVTISK